MKISFKKINLIFGNFLERTFKIKSSRLRKAVIVFTYLVAIVLLFGILPFILGIYLILLIFDKIKVNSFRYGLSFIVALIVLSIGIPWAGTTYSANFRNQNSSSSHKIEQTATPTPSPTPKVEVKTETKDEPVSFETKEEQTNTLSKGKTQVKQEGKDGKKVITFEVTYTDGKETSRKQTKEEVTEQSQTKIILVGTYVVPAKDNSSYVAPENNGSSPDNKVISGPSCPDGYYKNVDGNCVASPGSDSSGATAKCRDGSYSYSQHRQGTCSGHGGVAQWL